jgi:uncharacterized repeat protein (TIGR01451 family)
MLIATMELLLPAALKAQEAECAEVKIVIEQKLSLERQAFDAHMVIRNGLQSSALSNLKIELTYLDQNQQPVVVTTDPNAVGATFFERVDHMTGVNALDGSGALAAQTNADIHWLIIPAQGAGGDTASGRMYYIGAKVSYVLNGEALSVDVTPDYVVVRPQPLLELDYFLPKDVQGDDAMTPEAEPIEPFTLGVRVTNVGAGLSSKTTIESAQPKIVENRQGLLIDFRILGGYVGNQMLGKSLLLDFGDIPGHQAKMGRWMMETTLAGRFVEFNASFTHADSLGGAVTSLIKEVRAHTLVHDVLVDLPGHDDVYDFLAEAGSGYRVYDSLGATADVIEVSSQSSLTGSPSGNQRLTFIPAPGLIHAAQADPHMGKKALVRVLRSDGKVLPPQNFWLSKTRNADLTWSYHVHVFDSNTTGDYTLEFTQSSTASLAGSAYRDTNANGLRDTAEPADGNLGIVLKGVTATGQSILQQTYTDPDGTYAFVGLEPGRYQLEAAVEDGWIDGAWTAGSAGGTAQPGLIKDIPITAGTQAQGYLISKKKPAPTQSTDTADLAIAIQASKSQLRSAETSRITVTVRNDGDSSAQNVTAAMAVPTGLTLQAATASLGAHANGTWTVGGLTKGQSATLTLDVKADALSGAQDRSISWPVSVGSTTTDPKPSNNSSTLGLVILADKAAVLSLSQQLPTQARVLMLLSCPQASAASQTACESQAAQNAQSLLAATVQQLQTVTNLSDWHVAQRSNRHNVLWLHGGADKLDEPALAEIRAAVRRGHTLVVDGDPGPQGISPKLNTLADVMGTQVASLQPGASPAVRLPNQSTAQAVDGNLYELQLQSPTAQRMADSAATSVPVMVSNTLGLGQAWVAGFDLLASSQGTAASFWTPYAQAQMQAFTPVTRVTPALAGALIPVQATVRNQATADGAPQDAVVALQWPTGTRATDISPSPSLSEPLQAQWTWRVAPGQSATGSLQLTLPSATGSVQLQTTLRDSGAQVLDTQTLSMAIVGLDTLPTTVTQALSALNSAVADTQALIAQARQSAAAASTAQQQANWTTVLTELAHLQTQTDALAQPPHGLNIDPLRLDLARWLGAAQAQWTAPPATAQPAQITAQQGSGQSAVVGTAFANPLQALVVDAQGNPLSGVTVRFTAPSNGASAQFGGNSLSAEVLTNAQGQALSPVITANATVGTYTVSAQVNGLTPANFNLSNRSAIDSTAATLRTVSGTPQTTQVGTAFAQPLVVQVLNAAGQPVADALVQFDLSEQGPSAAFAGGAVRATVTTNAQGLAQSPALVANQTLGAHKATASVAGHITPVQFTLVNLASNSNGKQYTGTTTTASGTVAAALSGGGDTCVFNPAATGMAAAQGVWKPLQRILLPHGLFQFELVGCQAGGEVTISTTWPNLRGITGYLKYGPTAHSAGASIWYVPRNLHINGNTVTYTVRDGDLGDDDLTLNGVIRDPGGPVIETSTEGIPVMGVWGLVLLVSALVGSAWAQTAPTKRADLSCDAAAYTQPTKETVLGGAGASLPSAATYTPEERACWVDWAQAQAIGNAPGGQWVDIRDAGALRQISLPGVVPVDLANVRDKAFLQGQSLVLVGTGVDLKTLSTQCVALRESKRFNSVHVLLGGVRRWRTAGQPVLMHGLVELPDEVTPQALWVGALNDQWKVVTLGLDASQIQTLPVPAAQVLALNGPMPQMMQTLFAHLRGPADTSAHRQWLVVAANPAQLAQVRAQWGAQQAAQPNANPAWLQGAWPNHQEYMRQQRTLAAHVGQNLPRICGM